MDNRNWRRSRLFVAAGVVYGAVGILILLLRDILFRSSSSYFFATMFGAAIVLVSVGVFLVGYLRGDFESQRSNEDVDLLSKNWISDTSISPQDMSARLANLESQLRRRSRAALTELSHDQTESLLATLKTELTSVLSSDVLKQLEEKYSTQITQDAQLSQIRKGMEATSLRLRAEIAALSRRGNLNLVIGTLTTIVAVSLLGYLVAGASANYTTVRDLLSHLIPRVSIAIFIEVFSFFFLKLYKSSLGDIKYFQNELTNIEMRAVALDTALLVSQNTTTQPIIDQLIKTDRNPVASIVTADGKEASLLEPKDLASLLDKLAKLLSIGGHK